MRYKGKEGKGKRKKIFYFVIRSEMNLWKSSNETDKKKDDNGTDTKVSTKNEM